MTNPRLVIASALMLAVMPLAAENVNGFENFVLSRNDGHASAPAAIAGFSSRTKTTIVKTLRHFSSKKPTGIIIELH